MQNCYNQLIRTVIIIRIHTEMCMFLCVCISICYKHFQKTREAVVNHWEEGLEKWRKVDLLFHSFVYYLHLLLFHHSVFQYVILKVYSQWIELFYPKFLWLLHILFVEFSFLTRAFINFENTLPEVVWQGHLLQLQVGVLGCFQSIPISLAVFYLRFVKKPVVSFQKSWICIKKTEIIIKRWLFILNYLRIIKCDFKY